MANHEHNHNIFNFVKERKYISMHFIFILLFYFFFGLKICKSQLFQRRTHLGMIGVQSRATLEPLSTILLRCMRGIREGAWLGSNQEHPLNPSAQYCCDVWEVLGGPSIGSSWWREVLVVVNPNGFYYLIKINLLIVSI